MHHERHTARTKRRDNAYLGLLLALKLSFGILRFFLGFFNDLELSRKGLALALSEVYGGLLLVDLDGPGLQLLLLDLDLVVERTGFVYQGDSQSLGAQRYGVSTFQAFLDLFECLLLLRKGLLVFLYFLGLALRLGFVLFNRSLRFGVRVLLLHFD